MTSVRASRGERRRGLPGDELITNPIASLTHAITIRRPRRDIWPWLAQMGAGNRAGWYSYDVLDNGRQPSAARIIPELQSISVGTVFPAIPGVTDGFTILAFEPARFLVLGWLTPDGAPLVTWAFVLDDAEHGSTRLIVRARGGSGYQFHGLPWPVAKRIVPIVHFIMQRKQLLGIAERAEVAMSHPSAFKTPEGEAAYLAAYDAAMKWWPVPYEEIEVPSRFGMTHVIVSGPKDAPPLVLLHGYMATLTMWSANMADFSKDYRVYAIDVIGQPGKSVPDQPIRDAADYVSWLTVTLDALGLERVGLVGMSYGGWLALTFAVAAPERVQKLVLLSPAASFLPLVKQFSVRGLLMSLCPTRFTVNSFMRWLGFTDDPGDMDAGPMLDLMYLGLKHFRMPQETLRVVPTVFSDGELGAMHVPTLLLIGEGEAIYDPAAALDRARRVVPDLRGELVPRANHDMCLNQYRIVDARVLDFLKYSRRTFSERLVA